jgi:hypothetical protein
MHEEYVEPGLMLSSRLIPSKWTTPEFESPHAVCFQFRRAFHFRITNPRHLMVSSMVRHHAAQGVDSRFFFTPVIDVSTHTFEGSIELRPDQLDFAKLGRFVIWIHPNQTADGALGPSHC